MSDLSKGWSGVRCKLYHDGFVAMRGRGGGDDVEGSTMFFRNPELQERLISQLFLKNPQAETLSVLVVPGSVGCEALSYATIAHDLDRSRKIRIDTFDVSQDYTALAKLKTYPKVFENSIPEKYTKYARYKEDGNFSLEDEISDRVNVLPACAVLDFNPAEKYDLVVCMNLLMHLKAEDIPRVIEKLSDLSRGMIAFNNFDEIDLPQKEYEALENTLSNSFNLLGKSFQPLGNSVSLPSYLSFQAVKDFDGEDVLDRVWNVGSELDYTLALERI